ncbi:MAG: hypothetical protein J3T61_07655 [Candidatus Brocadiales bacterium]|nr:hypothetical protein [Candidatus Bathyanammoxibius sp.]
MRFLTPIRVITIFLITALAFATLQAQAATKYVSADFGFTISLPEGWTFKEFIQRRRIELYAPYSSGNKLIKAKVIIQYFKESDMPLETAALKDSTNLRNRMKSKFPLKITSGYNEKWSLASGQFAVLVFENWQSTEDRNFSYFQIRAYTFLGKKLFVIIVELNSLDSDDELMKKMWPDFNLIINSFDVAK